MQRFILLVGFVVSAFGAPVKLPETSKHVVPVPAKPTVKLPVPNLHGKAAAPVAAKPAEQLAAKSKHVVPVPEKPTVKLPVPNLHGKAAAPVAAKPAVKLAAKSKHVVPVPEKPTVKLPVPNLHAKAAAPVAAKPAVKLAAVPVAPVPEKPTVKLPVPKSVEPVPCKRLEACLAQGAGLKEDQEKTKLKTCIQSFCEDMRTRGKNVSESRVCGDDSKEVMDIIAMATKDKKTSLVALKTQNPIAYAAVFHTLFAQSSDVKQVTDACQLQSSTFLKASVQKHADSPAKLPEQGYEGKGVKHENMKSITSDFGAEYGPTTHAPLRAGAQGSSIAVAVVAMAIAALL